MNNSIDVDIAETLYKLQTLLEYSANPKAETIAELVTKARAIWNNEKLENLEDSY